MIRIDRPSGETMIPESFFPTIRNLKLSRKYVIFSALYGVTTLIVPLAVQFLVNNLALSGIWLNIVGFMIIIGAGLTLSLIMKYSQIILNEYLQREFFYSMASEWKENIPEDKRKYFVEVFFGMKSFSKSFNTVVEIALITVFGLLIIVIFHPGFLILPLLIGVTLYQIRQSNRPAIQSSIKVSDEKYALYEKVFLNAPLTDQNLKSYLAARDHRFGFIRWNTIKVFGLYVICQLALLGGGTYLVETAALSVGQLVSAEIILSNIMISLHKLPDALEGLYDFETSIYKLEKAKGVIHE